MPLCSSLFYLKTGHKFVAGIGADEIHFKSQLEQRVAGGKRSAG